MNKTFIAGTFLGLVGLGIVGAGVLYALDSDRVGEFVTSIITILGVGSAAIVTIYGLGQQGQKLNQIEKQTNGTLSKLQAENTRLTNLLVDRGVNPDQDGPKHGG